MLLGHELGKSVRHASGDGQKITFDKGAVSA